MASGPTTYREITFAAVFLGILQGIILTASFVYIGLKLGFGLTGSSVAAILGFALLRGVGRGLLKIPGAGSIVENNINQTIASGINTASSGVVFTFPALLLLGMQDELNVWAIIAAGVAGSFMGIIVIIPLRKQLIEIERLRFPSGVAVATILKSPGAGAKKAWLLGLGFLVGLLLTLATNSDVAQVLTGDDERTLGLIPETLNIGASILGIFGMEMKGAAGLALGGTALSLSMANFGAGLLSGKGGLPFALGGVLAWWVIGPFVVSQGWAPPGLEGEDLGLGRLRRDAAPGGDRDPDRRRARGGGRRVPGAQGRHQEPSVGGEARQAGRPGRGALADGAGGRPHRLFRGALRRRLRRGHGGR